jgi:hypothetical protein
LTTIALEHGHLVVLRRRLGLAPATGNRKTDMTDVITTATVPTASGSRYLQQLCKHWAHNLAVEFNASRGTITFPREGRAGTFPGDALVTLEAEPDMLVVRIAASAPEQLTAMKDAVARHLDRFAFREAPLMFDWR